MSDLNNNIISFFADGRPVPELLTEDELVEILRIPHGHSSFETTHKFYLAIKDDYIDKARQANVELGLKLEVGE